MSSPEETSPPPLGSLRSAWPVAALAGAFGALLLLLVVRAPSVGGDTRTLLEGSDIARHCISSGVWSSCGVGQQVYSAVKLDSGVAPFPLLQYLVAVPALAIGVTQAQVTTGFALLSVLAFAVLLLTAWLTVVRVAGPRAGAVVVLALLVSPLWWYANSTFAEMLAAALTTGVVAAALQHRSAVLIGLLVFVASVSKETAPPLIGFLAVLALFCVRPAAHRTDRSRLAAIVAGAVAGAVVNVAFNVFRYGTATNTTYLRDEFLAHGFHQRATRLLGLLVAPNGGLLEFWPLACVLLLLPVVLVVRRSADRRVRLLSAGVVLFAAALTLGLTGWWAPFGWYAWGPRLTLPWIPALLVLSAALGGPLLDRAVVALSSRRRLLAAIGAVAVLLMLPHLAATATPDVANRLFYGPPEGVAICTGPHTREACLHYRAFEHPSILLEAMRTLRSPLGLLLVLASVGLVAPVLRAATPAPAD